jgi:hypothetical protein
LSWALKPSSPAATEIGKGIGNAFATATLLFVVFEDIV